MNYYFHSGQCNCLHVWISFYDYTKFGNILCIINNIFILIDPAYVYMIYVLGCTQFDIELNQNIWHIDNNTINRM